MSKPPAATAARMRSALAPVLTPLGFSRRGSLFVLRQAELEHVVSVFAARRLAGYFEILHGVFENADDAPRSADRSPLVRGEIQGFIEPYPGLWAFEKLNGALAARQIAAIVRAFASLADVAHFYSDRPMAPRIRAPKPWAVAGAPNSRSEAEEEQLLRHHANAVFARHFTPAPRLGKEMWAHHQDVGGFRYCTCLVPNDTATFASLMYFPLASTDIEKGRKNDGALRALLSARKRVLTDEGTPVLLPLTGEAFDHAAVADALLRALAENPPNALPRRAG